jgi:hypothetical protein
MIVQEVHSIEDLALAFERAAENGVPTIMTAQDFRVAIGMISRVIMERDGYKFATESAEEANREWAHTCERLRIERDEAQRRASQLEIEMRRPVA